MKAEEEFSLRKKRAVVDIKTANAAGYYNGRSVSVRATRAIIQFIL